MLGAGGSVATSAQKTIVILGAMDTKSAELLFVRDQVLKEGCCAVILDFSVGSRPLIQGDITCEEVARAGGGRIEDLWGTPDRVTKNKVVTDGAISIVRQRYAEGSLHGILCVGGAGGTLIGTDIARALPFGVPKFVVSSNAAARGFSERYFGTKDITMMHTVVDVAGVTDMLRTLLIQAAAGVCAMARATAVAAPRSERDRPVVALCELMIEAEAVRFLKEALEDRGYEVNVFMATGVGDTAMEELIGEGRFDAVVDLSPGSIIDSLVAGTRIACPERLETAGRQGIPQIIAPGGLDFIAPAKSKYKPEYEVRKSYEPDSIRKLLRSSAKEVEGAAQVIAEKLNKAKGPVRILIPTRGWSTVSGSGRPLDDPEADQAFIVCLNKCLRPDIPVIEVEARIDEATFARAVVDSLDDMVTSSRRTMQTTVPTQ